MTKEEAIALLNKLSVPMQMLSASYATPFFWGDPRRDGDVHHGSAFFIQWDRGPFGVTANHVYKQCLRRMAESRGVVCQLGRGVKIEPSDRLLDCSDDPDIATFHITEDELRRIGKIAFTMPAFVPQEGKGIFFAGFPAIAREKLGEATYSLGIMNGLVTATSVGERNIVCQFDREYMVEPPPDPCDMNGVSGAFIAASVERNGMHLWQPAGVIYEYHPKLEILMANRLDRLSAAGSISK